jgi:hypothetical protein
MASWMLASCVLAGLAYIFLEESKKPWAGNRHSRGAFAVLDQPQHEVTYFT